MRKVPANSRHATSIILHPSPQSLCTFVSCHHTTSPLKATMVNVPRFKATTNEMRYSTQQRDIIGNNKVKLKRITRSRASVTVWMMSSLFRYVTRGRLIFGYRCCGKTYRSCVLGSNIPRFILGLFDGPMCLRNVAGQLTTYAAQRPRSAPNGVQQH